MSKMRLFVDRDAFEKKQFTLVDARTGEREDHWINLRSELTDEEYSQVDESMVESLRPETDDDGKTTTTLKVAIARAGIVQLEKWILAWSFTNARGVPVRPKGEFLSGLPKDVAKILRDIITDHAAEVISSKRVLTLEQWEKRQAAGEDVPPPKTEGNNPFDGSGPESETPVASSPALTLISSGTPSPEPED